jgi:hypothetical protein
VNLSIALSELLQIASTIESHELAKDLASGRLAHAIKGLEIAELSLAAIDLQLLRTRLEIMGDFQVAAVVDLIRDRGRR